MELHVLPLSVVKNLSNAVDWNQWFEELLQEGRAAKVFLAGQEAWIPAEMWPTIEAAYATVTCEHPPTLPPELRQKPEEMAARAAIVRGWMQLGGPTTVTELARKLVLPAEQVEGSLEMIEATGGVLRGRFHPDETDEEWCDRRLLARIHRLTLEGVRKRIQPVAGHDFLRLLLEHHGIESSASRRVEDKGLLMDVIHRLAGFEAPAGSWEFDLFATRLTHYDPSWLDQLTLTGEVAWGRLEPPAPTIDRKRMSGLTRVVPISIFPRTSLSWLLPEDRKSAEDFARGDALTLWEILQQRRPFPFRSSCG